MAMQHYVTLTIFSRKYLNFVAERDNSTICRSPFTKNIRASWGRERPALGGVVPSSYGAKFITQNS